MVSLSAKIHYIGEESKEKLKPSKKKQRTNKRPDIDLLNSDCLLHNLFPIDTEGEFLAKHFKKHPVVVRGNGNKDNLSVLKELLLDLDISELIKSSASERIHVWLSQKELEDALDSISVEDHVQALKLYRAGHSLYCRAPAELERAVVPRLLNDCRIGLLGSGTDKYRRGEIEMFFTRKGHSTDFHTDFQENFTIQISGKKKWIFRKSSANAPLRACTPHFQTVEKDVDTSTLGLKRMESDLSEQQLKVLRLGDPTFSADQYLNSEGENSEEENSDLCCVVLSPGDVLYHPAGIWHRVECEEDSISINVSLIVSSYAEIFCSGLQQLLWENPAFRGPVSSGESKNGKEPEALGVMKYLMDTVPILLEQMKPTDFLPLPCLQLQGNQEVESEGVSSSSHSNEKGAEKEVGSEDEEEDEQEEEEEDEEEEEEESYNSSNPILAENIPIHPALCKDKKSTKCTAADISFRINPLVKIIRSGDLAKFRNDQSNKRKMGSKGAKEQINENYEVFIVHSSYGNETFESVLRQVIIVPSSMSAEADFILGRFNFHQVWRQKAIEKYVPRPGCHRMTDPNLMWHKSAFISANNVTSFSKPKTTNSIRLLSAFVAAGALTETELISPEEIESEDKEDDEDDEES